MCAKQAEQLRIIPHMDSLEVCEINPDSLILVTAEKYLPQPNLVMTVSGLQSFTAPDGRQSASDRLSVQTTGRGFIGATLSQSGCEVTFIDVAEPAVRTLQENHCYPVRYVSSEVMRT